MEFFLFVWGACLVYYIMRPGAWALIGGALGYLIGKKNQTDPGQELAQAQVKINQLLEENKKLRKQLNDA